MPRIGERQSLLLFIFAYECIIQHNTQFNAPSQVNEPSHKQSAKNNHMFLTVYTSIHTFFFLAVLVGLMSISPLVCVLFLYYHLLRMSDLHRCFTLEVIGFCTIAVGTNVSQHAYVCLIGWLGRPFVQAPVFPDLAPIISVHIFILTNKMFYD